MIFSGTTEGRKLSKMLSAAAVEHIVSVVSQYGSDVMEKSPYLDVRIGRMDEEEMKEFLSSSGFEKDDVIVDATHPYALLASENIKKAAAFAGCRLYRVARKKDCTGFSDEICFYENIEEFAKFADSSEGNILLTTGSNTLPQYCKNVSAETLSRTYVRILPAKESMDICHDNGIEMSRIIAMQGPFTVEINRALFRQYDIRHMLTKESGAAGGFEEKMEAAAAAGVSCHVIVRPGEDADESGEDIYRVFEEITGSKHIPKRNIVLVGAGMGKTTVTADAFKILREADAVFGAKSVTAQYSEYIRTADVFDMYRADDIISVLACRRDIENIVVLFSGDPSFYSGAKDAYDRFRMWDEETEVTVLPGVSSVSYLCAKLGMSYDDAVITSVHGKNGGDAAVVLADLIHKNRKTLALTSSAEDVAKVAEIFADRGSDVTFHIGENLGRDDEMITVMSAKEAVSYEGNGKITVLFINPSPERKPIFDCLRDDVFLRDNVPMTKECIRHESIIRLGVCHGDTVYDIGGGTGAAALEIASLDPSVRVTTIERKPEAVNLIRRNIENLGIRNVEVIEGDAIEVLNELEAPDCVFIGGSGGRIKEIIDIISARKKGIRYVMNAVSLETIEEVSHIIEEYGISDERAVQIAVSEIKKAGSHHMMTAQNPVTIFSFTF